VNKEKVIDYLLLGCLALIWSMSFILIKIGVHSVEPFTLTAARLLIAAVLLSMLLMRYRQRLPFDRNALQLYLIVGIFGNTLPFALISWGEVYIDSSMAAILMGIMPISTFVLAHMFIPAEPMTGRKVIGVLFGFCGLLTLVGLSALGGIGHQLYGQLAVLTAALSYSCTAIYVRRRPSFSGIQMATGVTIVAATGSLIMAFALESPLQASPTRESILAILLLAVGPSAIASLIYFRVIRNLGAVTFAQINYLIPVLGSLWGILLLSELVSWRVIVALGLVLTGIYFVQPPRRNTGPPSDRQTESAVD